ncbi:hypothetical protein Agabi119p4_6145 [Agaricus bisporus var. burnettii]|uniref:Uncharacterized protein n=1 Tax=Agaricus bisporus var. burnettii TaxID=192524 RepID=A0A8H7F1A9_AGABI|nr:hypothetical protein Agabi119p4_6145 [Agaricus bisporus var. burnettii]
MTQVTEPFDFILDGVCYLSFMPELVLRRQYYVNHQEKPPKVIEKGIRVHHYLTAMGLQPIARPNKSPYISGQ